MRQTVSKHEGTRAEVSNLLLMSDILSCAGNVDTCLFVTPFIYTYICEKLDCFCRGNPLYSDDSFLLKYS